MNSTKEQDVYAYRYKQSLNNLSHRPPVRITQTVSGMTKKQTPKNRPLRIIIITSSQRFLVQCQQLLFLKAFRKCFGR
jgi:hypothetical protein